MSLYPLVKATLHPDVKTVLLAIVAAAAFIAAALVSVAPANPAFSAHSVTQHTQLR